jgi:hypothetical protein
MLSEVALRRGARLRWNEHGNHVAQDEASQTIILEVAEDLRTWLGYASVDELRADSVGGRLRRLRERERAGS